MALTFGWLGDPPQSTFHQDPSDNFVAIVPVKEGGIMVGLGGFPLPKGSPEDFPVS